MRLGRRGPRDLSGRMHGDGGTLGTCVVGKVLACMLRAQGLWPCESQQLVLIRRPALPQAGNSCDPLDLLTNETTEEGEIQ